MDIYIYTCVFTKIYSDIYICKRYYFCTQQFYKFHKQAFPRNHYLKTTTVYWTMCRPDSLCRNSANADQYYGTHNVIYDVISIVYAGQRCMMFTNES